MSNQKQQLIIIHIEESFDCRPDFVAFFQQGRGKPFVFLEFIFDFLEEDIVVSKLVKKGSFVFLKSLSLQQSFYKLYCIFLVLFGQNFFQKAFSIFLKILFKKKIDLDLKLFYKVLFGNCIFRVTLRLTQRIASPQHYDDFTALP